MKEYSNALNNQVEYMKGLQEENQKIKDENKELKRKVEILLSGLDNVKQALKARNAKPVKYRDENKELKKSIQELKELVKRSYFEGYADGVHCGGEAEVSWGHSHIKEELEKLSNFDSEEKE